MSLSRRPSRRGRPQKEQVDDAPTSLASATSTTGSLPSSLSSTSTTSLTSVGCPEKYADKRTMTPFQEKINAMTILPSGVYCLHYILSGRWIRAETLELATTALANNNNRRNKTISQSETITTTISDCIHWSLFPSLSYLPPPTILAICIGVLLHCPCSFLYHWKYAANPNATQRFKHWSRRLDHSAIHGCSIFWSYSISGGNHICFFLFNVLYNADCIRCHWEEEIKPRRNQLRILGSMLMYTSPMLFMNTDYHHHQDGSRRMQLLFCKVWAMFIVAVWFFAAYPIGGWSHAAFHIVMVAVPPLLLEMVAEMEAGGMWSMAAAQCAVLKLEL